MLCLASVAMKLDSVTQIRLIRGVGRWLGKGGLYRSIGKGSIDQRV